jgi:hypothetical protein
MFVVIGDWRMDPTAAVQQRDGLTRIVCGVGQLPGLVKGYWTANEDASRTHTFIVFEDRAQAEAFADTVRGNLENQRSVGVENLSLVIDEVTEQT